MQHLRIPKSMHPIRKAVRLILSSLFIYSLLFSTGSIAQSPAPYANREFKLYLNNFLNQDSSELKEFNTQLINYAQLERIDSILYPRQQKKNYFHRKLRRQSFVRVKTSDFFLQLDPIFNFNAGFDLKDSLHEKLITNSRGVWVKGNIGSDFSFESTFMENQSTFPTYMDAFVDTFKVVPGQGRWKKFKINGYDYAASSGTIAYAPFNFLSIRAGHGKPFIGSGYRSLLLSDNAFNYPFAQLNLHTKWINYSVTYASLQVVDRVRIYSSNLNEPLFKKKSASFQYLTLFPSKKFKLSLFQGTIFQVRDSIHPYFNWNVLNPVIFSSAFQYGLNKSPNVLLGADFKALVTKNITLYGQYVIDDFSSTRNALRNKSGFQLGGMYFNVFGIENLIVQAEVNRVRPYTYAHSIPSESYTHYGQSLTHPLGANFIEYLGFLNYHWKDIFVELKFNYAHYGADSLKKSYGKEVFASDNKAVNGLSSVNNSFLQGLRTNLMYQEIKLAYLINPATNLSVFAQIVNRSELSPITERNNTLIYFGIKTALFNNYYDF
ncbi:MAG: hypothetical protein IPP32_10910 [Bacteroidetes bacterium]|nr:hypothetical protein [Bacteroidota bacterium]